MAALKKNLESNLNERLRLREVEHNKLLQRYQNVKKEIENQQKKEMHTFEKEMQNVVKLIKELEKQRPGTANRSMMSSQMSKSGMRSKMGASKITTGNPASKPSYMR